MNDHVAYRIMEALESIAVTNERIADAYDKPSSHDDPEMTERIIAMQEKNVEVAEQRLEVERQHNEMHLRGVAHNAGNR